MTLQKLLSYVRRACADFDMIEEGDHVAAAVSGGKDSLALLAALSVLKNFYPNRFTLSAVTVDLGFPGFDMTRVAAYCESINVPYIIVSTDIGRIVFNERKEKNPCSLCAKMRKGALNNAAREAGITRVAYGHNREDVTDTFLLSLFFEGRLNTLEPVTWLDRSGLHLIRPLIYVPERDIIGFARKNNLPVVKSPCPADGSTKRREIAELTGALRKQYDHLDEKLFTAASALFR